MSYLKIVLYLAFFASKECIEIHSRICTCEIHPASKYKHLSPATTAVDAFCSYYNLAEVSGVNNDVFFILIPVPCSECAGKVFILSTLSLLLIFLTWMQSFIVVMSSAMWGMKSLNMPSGECFSASGWNPNSHTGHMRQSESGIR